MDRRQALKTLTLGAVAAPLVPGGAFALAEAAAAGKALGQTAIPAVPAGPFTLPPLGYAFDALEPHFDAATMQLHHDKHHAAYVNNLNKAVAGRKEVEGWPVERLVRDLAQVPEDIRVAVRNHGGGHLNHSLFWSSLKLAGARRPTGELASALDRAFGSFDAFRAKFDGAAAGVFGSGWAWLASDAQGALQVVATPNQDSPLTQGLVPLLGLDVWEHAYYLKFQNRRPEYIAAFHALADWDVVSTRYRDARQG